MRQTLMDTDTSPILQVRDLRLGFNMRQGMLDVLHGISFDLHRGKTTCIVGESGSGKSVTARAILNMVPRPGTINGGQILFNPDGSGQIDLTSLDPRGKPIRKIRGGRIGMIFQEPMSSLSPIHTIGNQITEVLQLHRNVDKKTARHMAIAALAQVEIPKPEKAVVAEIADEVVVMEQGHVVEKGDTHQVYNAPQHSYSKKLLTAVKRLTQPASAKVSSSKRAKDILQIRDLSLRFEKKEGFLQKVTDVTKAVDGVTFNLKKGESLGIVGESGSGKTTLGRCIARVYNPNSGVINYKGQDLMQANASELRETRKRMRMIFQDPFASLNPRMTVKQIIAEPLIINKLVNLKELEEYVSTILSQVGLDPKMMERYPHAFSGGQRQRIVIARAIALKPELIIADEPTSALDVSIRTQVLDLLLQLQAEMGLSFIFISHDMAVIRYFCDRIAVMYRGQIVEIGETEQIINNPKHPYTKALLSSVPIPDPALRGTRQRHRYEADT